MPEIKFYYDGAGQKASGKRRTKRQSYDINTEPEKLGAALSKKKPFCAALHKKEIRCRVFENIAAYISFIPVIVYFFKDVKNGAA